MIVTESLTRGTKFVFNTSQVREGEKERGRRVCVKGRERERERERKREIAHASHLHVAPLQASQIAHLIRDYTHIIVEKQKKSAHHVRRPAGAPPTKATPTKGGAAVGRRGKTAL